MSRTFKDRPWRLRFPRYLGAERRKAARSTDVEWRYLRQAPGWFITLFVESRRRAALRTWRYVVARCNAGELAELDTPPHPKVKREYFL
ncbi:hypothetical protein LJR039_005446 [Pseudorhodoferax sp. LjRoot39]|uniref:hypothetical protein n=1 Tax=Pseudorhodoferax sp. LjRoot39 TaxID=3342328 RepID=UPI003ECC61B4